MPFTKYEKYENSPLATIIKELRANISEKIKLNNQDAISNAWTYLLGLDQALLALDTIVPLLFSEGNEPGKPTLWWHRKAIGAQKNALNESLPALMGQDWKSRLLSLNNEVSSAANTTPKTNSDSQIDSFFTQLTEEEWMLVLPLFKKLKEKLPLGLFQLVSFCKPKALAGLWSTLSQLGKIPAEQDIYQLVHAPRQSNEPSFVYQLKLKSNLAAAPKVIDLDVKYQDLLAFVERIIHKYEQRLDQASLRCSPADNDQSAFSERDSSLRSEQGSGSNSPIFSSGRSSPELDHIQQPIDTQVVQTEEMRASTPRLYSGLPEIRRKKHGDLINVLVPLRSQQWSLHSRHGFFDNIKLSGKAAVRLENVIDQLNVVFDVYLWDVASDEDALNTLKTACQKVFEAPENQVLAQHRGFLAFIRTLFEAIAKLFNSNYGQTKTKRMMRETENELEKIYSPSRRTV